MIKSVPRNFLDVDLSFRGEGLEEPFIFLFTSPEEDLTDKLE